MEDRTLVTKSQGAVLVSTALQNQNDEATRLYNWQQDNDIVSAGFGKYGVPKEEVQDLSITAIWCDPDVYCFGEADEEARDNPGELEVLKDSFHMHAFRDELGVIRSSLWQPIITIERTDPADARHRHTLMIVSGWRAWKASLLLVEQGWTVIPGLVRPDFGDYRIEYASLHNQCQQSTPTIFEIAKHVAHLNWCWDQGFAPAGAPQPPKLVEAARALGKSPSYFSKIGRLWQLQAADDAYAAGVPVRVIIKAAETYGDSPRLAEALHHIAEKRMNTPTAEQFIKTDNAALRLTEARTQRSALPSPAASIMPSLAPTSTPAPVVHTIESVPTFSTLSAPMAAAPMAALSTPVMGRTVVEVVKDILRLLEDTLMLLEGESKPQAQAGLGDNYKTFLQTIKRQRDIADELYLSSIAQGK